MRLARIIAALAAGVLWAHSFARAEETATFDVAGLNFRVPAGWVSVSPSSPMRKAELHIAGPDGTGDAGKAVVTVFHFGAGQGGTVEQNVERWFAQFGGNKDAIGAATAKETLGKTPVTFVRAHGTFQSGMPGGPTSPVEGQALLGAIIENPQAGDVYLKMTGPSPTVEKAEPAFVEMIRAACK